jgi:FkbM family methyltransferase
MLWRVNVSIRGTFESTPVIVPLIFGNGPQELEIGEAWLLGVMRRLFTLQTGAFVDVGMNLGQTLLKVKLLDPSREYIGFEPNPRAFDYAAHLVQRNKFTACTLVPAGLSSRTGVTTLFSTADVDPSASLVAGFRPESRYTRTQLVVVLRGDDVMADLGIQQIGILKIDVEGGELDVLEGIRALLERDRPYVLCEVLPVGDPTTPTGAFRLERQTRLEVLLRELRYEIYRIRSDGSVVPLQSFGVHAGPAESNYVFVPSSDAGAFEPHFLAAM